MPTPNEAYNSNSVPFAGFTVRIFRNRDNPVQIGEYILESASPADSANVIDRPAADGGDNGFVVVNGKTEGNAVFQLPAVGSPTLKNGDMFRCSKFSNDANGNAEVRYFVVHNPSPTIGMQEYRKQSCTIREDKFPTATMQSQVTEAA